MDEAFFEFIFSLLALFSSVLFFLISSSLPQCLLSSYSFLTSFTSFVSPFLPFLRSFLISLPYSLSSFLSLSFILSLSPSIPLKILFLPSFLPSSLPSCSDWITFLSVLLMEPVQANVKSFQCSWAAM